MKKLTTVLVIMIIGLSSCSNQITLQKYFVEKSGQEDFFSLTIPADILKLKDSISDPETEDALNRFERLNVIYYKAENESKVDQKKEEATIKEILANSDAKEMMSMNIQGYFAEMLYIGDNDKIKEVIVFATGKEGFLLARITGKEISVKQLAKLASSINFENMDLGSIGAFNQ